MAAVETHRAQRVGRGEPLQRGAAELAASPQRLGIGVAGAARRDETRRILFGKPFDLAKPKPQCEVVVGRGWIDMARPSRRALWALLRMTVFIMPSKNAVILRRLRSSRLEGRTVGPAAGGKRLQRAVPVAVVDVDRQHRDAMLARVADDLRRLVEAHRLRVKQRAGKDLGMKAFDPGRDIDQ